MFETKLLMMKSRCFLRSSFANILNSSTPYLGIRGTVLGTYSVSTYNLSHRQEELLPVYLGLHAKCLTSELSWVLQEMRTHYPQIHATTTTQLILRPRSQSISRKASKGRASRGIFVHGTDRGEPTGR